MGSILMFDAMSPRMLAFFQLPDGLFRYLQLVGQVLDPFTHQVLLLLLHDDGPLEGFFKPNFVNFHGICELRIFIVI